jgi:hypothetical protein
VRTFGKSCVAIAGAIIVLWLVALVVHQALASVVPGCRTGAKGFAINCGWASGPINFLSDVGGFLGVSLLIAVPALILGGVLWVLGAWLDVRRSNDA